MENVHILIETWGGHITSEQLASAIEVAIQQLSGAKIASVSIEGVDNTTAVGASTILSKNLAPEECRVTKYNAVTLKVRIN